jgi:hypothetical protein
MHFACYQYFTHFFLSSKTVGKKSNSYKDIVTSPLSSERKTLHTKVLFAFHILLARSSAHTSTEDKTQWI